MRRSINVIPLIVEPHPPNYTGYKFISMIRYNDMNTLNVIDNIIDKSIYAYTLDLCGPENVDETQFIEISVEWYASERYKSHPLSIEFSRLGWSSQASKILRVFPLDYVTRVVGIFNEYPMNGYSHSRKRRKRSLNDSRQSAIS